ncbi:MAG: hypothetical protein HYZ54_11840 [Ignavibacteriae bacterium]|nr:hypothetical protein [Ignavibacteriota bacterium]
MLHRLILSIFIGFVAYNTVSAQQLVSVLNYFTFKGEALPPQAFSGNNHFVAKKTSRTLVEGFTEMAGHFRITFSRETNDPAGGYFHPQLGEARRNVLLAVLTDISALIKRPHRNSDTVEILALCSNKHDGTAAQATAIYADDPAGQSGILDGAVWSTLNSGTDAFKYLPNRPAYHGIIEINVGNTLNLDYNSVSFTGIDLYTVLLHECLHTLGVASFIQADGSSLRRGGYYTRFDTFVQTADNKPLIIHDDQCYTTHYNTIIDPLILHKPCTSGMPALVFAGRSSNRLPIYTPKVFSLGTSICHIDTDCDDVHSVMTYSIQNGITRRAPTVTDVRMLEDLGYALTDKYGKSENGGGRFASFPVIGEFTASGNDELLIQYDKPETMMFNASDLLNNDVGVNDINCSDVIGGSIIGTIVKASDSLKSIYGKEYVFIRGKGFYGVAIVRYLGKNTIGSKSNIAYLVIRVKLQGGGNCPPQEYFTLCNGGFEQTQGGGPFEKYGVTNHCSPLSPLIGWENMPATPDVFTRKGSGRINLQPINTLFPTDTIQTEIQAPIAPEAWDNDVKNEVMVGIFNRVITNFPPDREKKYYTNEGLTQHFYPKNIDILGLYTLEFHTFGTHVGLEKINNSRISVNIVENDICSRYPDYNELNNLPPDFGGMVILDTTFTHFKWHKLRSKPFRFKNENYTQLIIYSNKLKLADTNQVYNNYIFLDDVRLRPAGYGFDVLPSTQYPCSGEEVPFVITLCWDGEEYIRPLKLHAVLPDGLEFLDGDFTLENGQIIAHVSGEKPDSGGCITKVLRTRVSSDPRFQNLPQRVQIIPDDVPESQADRFGKSSASIIPSVPAMTVRKTITKIRETDSADYFSIRTTVCNSSTTPVRSVSIIDSLISDLRLMDTSVRLNNLSLTTSPSIYNPKYLKHGYLFTFRSFDLPPRFISSGDSSSSCSVLEYVIKVPSRYNLFSIPSTVRAEGSVCEIKSTTEWGGQRLGGSVSDNPVILNITPNPVQDQAVISINIPLTGRYSCTLYDILGRVTQTLIGGYIDSGRYQFDISTSDLVCGSYCIVLQGNNNSDGKLLSIWR